MSLTKGSEPFGEHPAKVFNFDPHPPEDVLYVERTRRRVRVLLGGELVGRQRRRATAPPARPDTDLRSAWVLLFSAETSMVSQRRDTTSMTAIAAELAREVGEVVAPDAVGLPDDPVRPGRPDNGFTRRKALRHTALGVQNSADGRGRNP